MSPHLKTYLSTFFIALCLIQSTFGADYFWIGGSGDWSDISHWAVSSGGTQTHPQTPTANDDVHFDANSFTASGQVVTINGTLATARDINWDGAGFNPTFRSTLLSTNFQIYGSVNLIPQMNFQYAGILTFIGNEPEARLVNFENFNQGIEIVFRGTQGSWNLINNIQVADRITFMSGTLNLGDATITAAYFISKTSESRVLNFQNATLNLTGQTNDLSFLGYELNLYPLDIYSTNFTSSGGASTTNIVHPNGKVFMRNGGQLEMGTLVFSNTSGLSEILNLNFATDFSLTGNLVCNHSTNIRSPMTVDRMVLAPGYTYQLESSKVIELNGIDLVGTCTSPTFLNSLTSGVNTTIRTAQPFTINYVTMRDVQMQGAGTSNNTIDLGNNVGWNLTSKNSQNFYWIGGNGNWSDGSHWSFTSGGSPSGCIPSAVDDVFFNENSFNANNQTVVVDLKTSFARNMTWSNVRNGSTLEGTEDKILYINGSLAFDMNMVNDFFGVVTFIADDDDNTITSHGTQFRNNIEFNNSAGVWTAIDDFYVQFDLVHISGELIFDDIFASVQNYYSDFTNNRTLRLGSSTFELAQRTGSNDQPFMNINILNYTLDAGTSHIVFEGAFRGQISVHGRDVQLEFHNVEYRTIEGNFGYYVQGPVAFKVNSLIFRQNGDISGTGSIDSLELTPG